MSMPLHALGFYSPQAGSWRATVKEELAHLSDARGATPKLGDRSDVMTNVTMQLMGEDSDGRLSSARASLACSLRMSSEPECGLVGKLAWDQSDLPSDHRGMYHLQNGAYLSLSVVRYHP